MDSKVNTRVTSEPRDFKTLFIKLEKGTFAQHSLFVKEHRVRESCPEKPQNRTLFVVNVPPYLDDTAMKELFRPYGEVETVHFHSKPTSSTQDKGISIYFSKPDNIVTGFKVSYVVFKYQKDLRNVVKLKDGTTLKVNNETLDSNTGLNKWVSEYNTSVVNVTDLQKEIDDYMETYDASVESEIQKAKESEGVPDAEGWITVTRHGKRPVVPRHEAVEKKISKKEKKKRSQKQLLNFYTFQIKETKMEHIAQLRKKFEEDKKRIGLMRMTRKFKPF